MYFFKKHIKTLRVSEKGFLWLSAVVRHRLIKWLYFYGFHVLAGENDGFRTGSGVIGFGKDSVDFRVVGIGVMVGESDVPDPAVFPEPRDVLSGSVAVSGGPCFIGWTIVLGVPDEEVGAGDMVPEGVRDAVGVFVVREEDEGFAGGTFFETVADGVFRMRGLDHLDDQALRYRIFSFPDGDEVSFFFEPLEFVEFHFLFPSFRMENENGSRRVVDLHEAEVGFHFDRIQRMERRLHKGFEHFLGSDRLVDRPEQFHVDGLDIGRRGQKESLGMVMVIVREEGDDF